MNAYAGDPRVIDLGGTAFTVVPEGSAEGRPVAAVRRATDTAWYAFPYGLNEAPHAEPYPTVDEAIRSLIGDPR